MSSKVDRQVSPVHPIRAQATIDRRRSIPRSGDPPCAKELGAQGYLRYVDDMVLVDDEKRRLADWRERIREHLTTGSNGPGDACVTTHVNSHLTYLGFEP